VYRNVKREVATISPLSSNRVQGIANPVNHEFGDTVGHDPLWFHEIRTQASHNSLKERIFARSCGLMASERGRVDAGWPTFGSVVSGRIPVGDLPDHPFNLPFAAIESRPTTL